jgi:hypothetical protein
MLRRGGLDERQRGIGLGVERDGDDLEAPGV